MERAAPTIRIRWATLPNLMPDLAFTGFGLLLLLIGGICLFFPSHAKVIFGDEDTPTDSKPTPLSQRVRLGIQMTGLILIACGLAMIYVSVFGVNVQPADDIPGV